MFKKTLVGLLLITANILLLSPGMAKDAAKADKDQGQSQAAGRSAVHMSEQGMLKSNAQYRFESMRQQALAEQRMREAAKKHAKAKQQGQAKKSVGRGQDK